MFTILWMKRWNNGEVLKIANKEKLILKDISNTAVWQRNYELLKFIIYGKIEDWKDLRRKKILWLKNIC